MSTLSLSKELALAVEVALGAGAMLREERARPGGPRGSVDHADIDSEAERWIRDRLTRATTWRYLGEETGEVVGDASVPLWVVDPNDGTAAYLRGFRGSAVSIAALHEGRPVLGVVYAYAFPDDEGDLYAWAEGCGPLTRNRLPVERTLVDRALTTEDVVCVSQDADRNPMANAQCTHPARFFPLPSIAHRLARAAGGLAIAGVSLSACVSWDIAAGHALLLAAGGDLVDENGAPVRYDAKGRARTVRCFGGSKAAIADLAKRPWNEVRTRPHIDHDSRYPRVRPVHGRSASSVERLRRAQGCLLGQLVGDALGELVEFETPDRIAQRYPEGVRALHDGGTHGTLAGQPTDDSELALLLARTLVRDGRFEVGAVRDAYQHWLATKPFDVGHTTASGLQGSPRTESQANGALMRVSPLGIFAAGRRAEGVSWARHEAGITHPHLVCRDASAVFVAALATAMEGGDAHACHEAALATCEEADVRRALVDARTHEPEDFLTHEGWVLIALQNAFFHLLHADRFDEALTATIMKGGDSDTNGAIVGALLGAVMGRHAIPESLWMRAITCRPLALVGARHPRPMELWPVDALEIAEALTSAAG